MTTSKLPFFTAFSLFSGKGSPSTKTIIILFGPPGSGKGTQALRLSKELSIPHISTGDLFRENIRNGTEIGKQVKAIIDSGKLVSDEIVLSMLQERVIQPDTVNGYILDGVPRRLSQAVALERQLDDRPIVLDLQVSDKVIVERITGRLTCKNGHTAHKIFNPPKNPGICDVCGEPLFHRADDEEDVVMERLRHYHDETAPVIEFYESKGTITHVDGEMKPDEVFQALIGAVQTVR